MADGSWEHASEARAALNAIVADPDHGVAALSNAQTMSNLLKDYLPDAPREKSILVAAAEAGLADTLREHVSEGMDPDTAIRLTASSFSSSTPFTTEACNWVADELAVALGISQPRPPGGSQAAGGPPAGVGMPSGAGSPAAPGGSAQLTNQAPGQPQAPAQGVAAPGQPDLPTAPGYRPGYGPAPQPGSGFVQQPGQGYPGQQPRPQAYPAQPFPGQPTQGQPFPGQPTQGQPAQPYPGQQYQPAGAYSGQPGFVQPAQPGTPGGWNPGGPAPYSPAGFGGPPKPSGGKRGLLVAGGIIVLVVVIAIVVALTTSHKPGKHHQAGGGGGSPTAPPSTPSTSPSTTPAPSGGVESLSTILNPAGLTPVGIDCTTTDLLGLKASTVVGRVICTAATSKDITVWAYQFDNHADYLAGLAHLNSVDGFHQSVPNTGCNPAVETADGSTSWFANGNPKYYQLRGTQKVARPGQVLECFVETGVHQPALIWGMPTNHVVFIAWDDGTGARVTSIVTWWKHVNYG